jgi:2'-5' RNA ligase
MRLFIALNFSDEVINSIASAQAFVKKNSLRGSFPPRENFHLTLAFIGETDKASEIKEALKLVSAPKFIISLGALGAFKGRDGDTCWCGVEAQELAPLHAQVASCLTRAGIDFDKKKFSPHVTLGRRVALKSPDALREFAFNPESCLIKEINLVKSETLGGRQVYASIYKRELK